MAREKTRGILADTSCTYTQGNGDSRERDYYGRAKARKEISPTHLLPQLLNNGRHLLGVTPFSLRALLQLRHDYFHLVRLCHSCLGLGLAVLACFDRGLDLTPELLRGLGHASPSLRAQTGNEVKAVGCLQRQEEAKARKRKGLGSGGAAEGQVDPAGAIAEGGKQSRQEGSSVGDVRRGRM